LADQIKHRMMLVRFDAVDSRVFGDSNILNIEFNATQNRWVAAGKVMFTDEELHSLFGRIGAVLQTELKS
jgi:hypothetical protein